MSAQYRDPTPSEDAGRTADPIIEARHEAALLKTGALQNAILNSANFSSIATDERGVIQLFNVGAECMLGYTAFEVVDKITPADISDPQEVIARAKALSVELATPITPGFEALVFKASRGIEDIYELTYIRKDGSRFPAVVSVTALRDDLGGIIGYLLIGTDNTVRKRVEAEQKQLDQRLRDQQFYTRALIESSVDALMTTDPAGIITEVNKQMEALTGCTRDELIGAPFKNCFTDPERAEAGIKRVLTGSKVTDYELIARARDGKETVVSYNATTFLDRDRKLQGVFAAARVVSERKRTLQENTVELERAKAAVEEADLGKLDSPCRLSYDVHIPMNAIQGMADMPWESQLDALVKSKTELRGTAFLDLISPGDLPAVSSALKTLKEGGRYIDFECTCRGADGSPIVLRWSVSKNEATGVRYWVGREVTERKRTEALLAGQAKAIDASQAVIEFRMDGTIIAANERFLALMEYGADDIVGQHHRIFVQPEYAASPKYSEFWRALGRGEFQAGEFQRFTKNGHSVWLQATYTPIIGLDGKPEKVVKFATNITERIAAERQLQSLNGTLSRSLVLSRQQDKDNSVLSEATAFLQASLTEDEVRNLVGRYIDRLSGKATAAVYFFAGDHEGERQPGSHDTAEFEQTMARTDCWALRRGMIHTRLAGTLAPICKHLSKHVRLEAVSTCVPIFASGVLSGLFTAFWDAQEPGDLHAAENERTQSMFRTLAGRVGCSLEAIRLRSRLEEESIRDSLTGLYNRRYLDDALRRELEHAWRLHLHVSAVMLDIDRFKLLNDTHGHEIGDMALRAVAQTISDTVRQSDIVCRYGGEEFAVLFVGVSLDAAAMKAEAIRAAVACLDIGGRGHETIKLTVSAGVSEAGPHPKDGISMLRRADRALYQAKDNGRNLVRVYADHQGSYPTLSTEATPVIPKMAMSGGKNGARAGGKSMRNSLRIGVPRGRRHSG